MKKLFISIFTAVFALFALGTSTFAWFSMNTTASATGMEVKAIAGSSLQISKTTGFTTGVTTISFSPDVYTLMPATEYVSQTGPESAALNPSSKLVAVNNAKDVDPNTGLAKSGKELNYKVADQEATTALAGYYIDYVMYLAAEGTEENITSGKVQITVTAPASFEEYALTATSIMVLDASGTKCGQTIKLRDGVANMDIITLSSTNMIPAKVNGTRTETGALKITLRVFIDGALQDQTGTLNTTYVRNTEVVDLSKSVSFGVVFDLVQGA